VSSDFEDACADQAGEVERAMLSAALAHLLNAKTPMRQGVYDAIVSLLRNPEELEIFFDNLADTLGVKYKAPRRKSKSRS
jgi:hypothetical protein